jgi:hypothetical protein
MPYSDEAIQTILDAHRELSTAETLELYVTVRNQVLVAAYTEHGTKRIEIRQRQHEVSDPADFLKFLEDQIDRYKQKLASEVGGASRNYARLNMKARR